MDLLEELWDAIKDDIPDKQKSIVLRHMCVVLEDYGVIDEDALMSLADHDKVWKEVYEAIYKEDLEEDEEEEDWDY